MAMFLKQSTASQEILLGPFVDSADGNTAETALTIANTDIKLFKEGATTLADKNSGGATHISNGYYYAVLDATDTGTVGQLEVNVKVAGALAVRREFQVVEEAVYDALFASSAAGYQVPIWASASSTVSLTNTTVATVTTTTTATNVTTVNGLAANVITATSINADAITAAKIANGAIDAATFAADVDAEILSYLVDDATRIDASALNTATVTTIPTNLDATVSSRSTVTTAQVNTEVDTALADVRLDELLAADSDIDGAAPPTVGSVFHELMTKTAGSFTYDQTTDSLEALRDRGDSAWITATGFSTHSAADVWAVATRVLTAATNISGPIADQVWEEAIADHSGTAGSTAEALNAAGSAGDPWNTALPGAYTAGKAGYILGTNLDALITSRMATYTQPTGFLAATFPGTVASTTNITAGTITTATNVTTVNGLAANVITAAAIADGAIDRATFATDTGLQTIRSGTAQAGAAGTITLDASASAVNDFYKGRTIELTEGTGAGQVEICFSYNGTTKVATMGKNWVVTPDNTTKFAVKGDYAHMVTSSLYASSDIAAVSSVSGNNVSGLSQIGSAYFAGTLTTNVTGNITGNLSGSVGSVTGTIGGLSAAALADFFDTNSGTTYASAIAGSVVKEIADNAGGSGLTAGAIADAVWDEAISGHLTAGTTGAKLNSAASAGDPWSTSLPGSYGSGEAGFILGTMRASTFATTFPIVSEDNSLEIVIGDDYYAADSRNLSFSIGASPSLSGATVKFKIQLTEDDIGYSSSNLATSTTGSVSGTTTQVITFDIPGTTTDDLSEGWHDYEVEATLSNSHVVTLVRGRIHALSQVVT